MPEYTYADVIIDPEDPRVEIGATYYFALGAQACIEYANSGRRKNTLDGVDKSGEYNPFITDEKDYPFIIRKKEPSYAEHQAKWIADNDVKKGDKVRIARKADSKEDGWGNNWNPDMDEAVGKVGTVSHISANLRECGIEVDVPDVGPFLYPYFVLEKVKKKYVPFKLSDRDALSKLMGCWLIDKDHGDYYCITAIYPFDERIYIPDYGDVSPEELLENFTFMFDGTPCGQEEE